MELVDILIGITTGFGVLMAWWAKIQAEKAENSEKKYKDFLATTLKLHVNLHKWSYIEEDLKELMESSEIDRFLILRCWNGETTPEKTTAVYQYRLGNQERFEYISVDLDEDYRRRLNEMHSTSKHYVALKNLPESMIKSIYEAEGVWHSVWFPIQTSNMPGMTSVIHTYCSFASHSDEIISKKTQQKCQNLAWKISDILKEPK
jgi:hypothetical protein